MVLTDNHWLGTGNENVDVSEDNLISNLKAVIATAGSKHFLTAPILEPTESYFPDQWVSSAEGVRVVTQRLLNYAGLGDLKAQVDVYDDAGWAALRRKQDGGSHHGASGLFFGIEGNVVGFGCDAGNIFRPESLVATMGHEVAHAFRAYHRLVGDDSAIEEILTDVTAVYLGFGVFSCNASRVYEKRAEQVGMSTVTSESVLRTGYLPPAAFAYLLAVQVVCRNLKNRDRRGLLKKLEVCHRDYFNQCHRGLRGERSLLLKALGIAEKACCKTETPCFSEADLVEPEKLTGERSIESPQAIVPQCKSCGGEIDYDVEICPHCNAQLSIGKLTVGVWIGIILFIIVVLWFTWPY